MFGHYNTRSYSHSISSSCTRCGHIHVYGQCRALKATCNNCFLVGHYARLCKIQKHKSAVKSKKTKQRDIERMTNFVRKKTFQSNLPFYNVEDEYLRNNEVNLAVSSAAHVSAILKLEVNTLEIQNTLLVNNNTDLKNETELLKNANDKLEQTLKQTSNNFLSFLLLTMLSAAVTMAAIS